MFKYLLSFHTIYTKACNIIQCWQFVDAKSYGKILKLTFRIALQECFCLFVCLFIYLYNKYSRFPRRLYVCSCMNKRLHLCCHKNSLSLFNALIPYITILYYYFFLNRKLQDACTIQKRILKNMIHRPGKTQNLLAATCNDLYSMSF